MSRRPRSVAAVVLSLVVTAVATAAAAPTPPETAPQRADLLRREASLAAAAGAALAELTALERELAGAARELAALRARAAAHRRHGARLERRLRLVRHNHRVAGRALAERLLALYVDRAPQPLEVVLGARSLNDAMTALDGLGFAAERDRQLVTAAAAGRARLATLRRRVARAEARIRRLEDAQAARVDTLARARTQKAVLVAGLAAERRLTADAVSRLERHARATARAAPGAAGVRASPVAPSAPPAPAPAPASAARTLTVVASGYALTGPTATGVPAGPGIVAVDPAVIPLGTRMTVPGYGEGVAADVGSAVRGAEIDLWFPTRAEALRWGRRVVTISLHSAPAE